MIRRTLHYSGHVQGVGFRHTTAKLAQRFAVAGTVQNLSDGRVELIVEGEPREINDFTAAVAETMPHHIQDVKTRDSPATGNFAGPVTPNRFGVIH